MVNVTDILDRTAALEKKYDKYLNPDQPKAKAVPKGDQFQTEFDEIDEAAARLAEDAALISQIKDRSKIALQNADVRKRKAALNTRILGLDNLIKKGKTTKAIITERRHNIEQLQEKVDAIPDGGVNVGRKKPGAAQGKRGMFGGTKPGEVRIEMGDMGGSNGDAAYYQDTEENAAFRQEFEDRKVKQDAVLDEIERGVGRMGDIATDMGQELGKQDKLMDEVEGQMDTATKAVQTNNQKLKGVLTRIRSGRNFCMDMILITVLLAIAGYIYTLVG